MRSDEERDQCIDMLIAKVQALEAEIADLKGAEPSEEVQAVQRDTGLDEPRGAPVYEPRGAPVYEPRGALVSEPRQQDRSSKAADSSLESAIGTRWIGRIGILAIIFGVAFFLKYSFDNDLIGETGRIILGIVFGALFLGIGEYLQKKRGMRLYGQMLSGGGLAVLYLAIYAAFALYHLIPTALAAVGMIAVTTTGMTLSIRYSTYSLSAIAITGGFLTPVLLSTGQNQPITLFGYILLLDIGTLALLRFRQWPSLAAASLCGTVILYCGWHTRYFTDAQQWLAFGIILLFFIFYNLYIVTSRLYPRRTESKLDPIMVFGSAALFFLAFFSQHRWKSTWPVGTFTLALAGFEIGMAELVRRRAPANRLTVAAYGAVSVIMTTTAILVTLGKHWIMAALATEMAVLGWIGLRLALPSLRRAAYLLGLIVLYRFTVDIVLRLEPFERFIPIFNSRFLDCAMAVAGFLVLMKFLSRERDRLGDNERDVGAVIFVVTQLLLLVLLSAEVHDFFRFRSPRHILDWGTRHYAFQVSLSVLWALYASLLTGLGILKRVRIARVFGILLLGVTVLKVFFIDLSALQTFYRIISFVVLGLLLLAVSYGYNRFKHFIFGEDKP